MTASLLALEAQSDGLRVLIVGGAHRTERLATLFGSAAPTAGTPTIRADRDIHVSASVPQMFDADLILSVPSGRALDLLDAAEELAAFSCPVTALVLASQEGGSLAAAFAVFKLLLARRPQFVAAVAPMGDTDIGALSEATERWLGRPLISTIAIPRDPTLPVALAAGIPLAEAVADTALLASAATLWSALSSSVPAGVTA